MAHNTTTPSSTPPSPGTQAPAQWTDTQDQSNQHRLPRLLIILSALAFTLFVSFIDQTSVSTALPTIALDLSAFSSISWVGTSFLVANTAFQLVNGRLSDIFGRKNCLLTCMLLLALGDLACGFARTPSQLYGFRGLAGVGAGGINSLVMITFTDMTTLKQRGKYQGVLETMIALGNGVGPLIGGAFAESRATWRWAFWFVVPVTVCAGAAVAWTLPRSNVEGNIGEKVKMIDFWGMGLSLGATVFVLIPVSSGGTTYAWNSPLVISFLVVGGLLFVAFIYMEWKVAAYPVVPMRVFERPAAKIMFAHNFITGIVYYADLYYLPLYYQIVLGQSPLRSGVLMLPLILGFSLSSTVAGIFTSRLGRCNPVIWTGYTIWTAGSGAKIAFDKESSIGMIVGCLVLSGIGLGFSMQPVMLSLLANTRKEDRAVVTGLRNFLRTIGGAIGLAMGGAIINNLLQSNLPESLHGQSALELTSKLGELSVNDRAAVREAYMSGLKIVFRLGCPLIGVCLLSGFFLQDVHLATAHAGQDEEKREVRTVNGVNEEAQGELGLAQASRPTRQAQIAEKEAP